MKKTRSDIPFATIMLDPASDLPLYRQLYNGLREGIINSRFTRGTRLPATRTLARDLAISRNTVVAAFEQLLAEGYLIGKIGAGTYVSLRLPEEKLTPDATQQLYETSG